MKMKRAGKGPGTGIRDACENLAPWKGGRVWSCKQSPDLPGGPEGVAIPKGGTVAWRRRSRGSGLDFRAGGQPASSHCLSLAQLPIKMSVKEEEDQDSQQHPRSNRKPNLRMWKKLSPLIQQMELDYEKSTQASGFASSHRSHLARCRQTRCTPSWHRDPELEAHEAVPTRTQGSQVARLQGHLRLRELLPTHTYTYHTHSHHIHTTHTHTHTHSHLHTPYTSTHTHTPRTHRPCFYIHKVTVNSGKQLGRI